MSDTDQDLWHEVDQLNGLVRRRLPVGHVVRDYFDAAFKGLSVGEVPDPDAVRRARVAFYRLLTREEQRRVLNGWTPAARRPPRRQVLATAAHENVERVMFIEATRRVATSCHDVVLTWGDAPVLVRVREGATSADVLAALRKAIDLVTEQWASIVADVPQFDEDDDAAAHEEGDAPDTFPTPLIGVSKGERAFAPTAA